MQSAEKNYQYILMTMVTFTVFPEAHALLREFVRRMRLYLEVKAHALLSEDPHFGGCSALSSSRRCLLESRTHTRRVLLFHFHAYYVLYDYGTKQATDLTVHAMQRTLAMQTPLSFRPF